tara:strand:- start:51 stop:422 length:372 start_codon:yes stop_codon:yes gene_type:complete
MKYLIVFSLLIVSGLAFAEDPQPQPSVFDTLLGTSYNTWIDTTLERVAAWFIVSWIEFKVWALSFSYDVAVLVVSSFNLTAQIEAYLQSMSPVMYNWVSYLRIIDGVNILLSSYGAAMIMRLF